MIETVLGIEGMMCGMCEAHINDEIRRHFTVKSVSSSRKKKQCVVLSEQALDPERLRQVIAGTGYELTSVTASEHGKKRPLRLKKNHPSG